MLPMWSNGLRTPSVIQLVTLRPLTELLAEMKVTARTPALLAPCIAMFRPRIVRGNPCTVDRSRPRIRRMVLLGLAFVPKSKAIDVRLALSSRDDTHTRPLRLATPRLTIRAMAPLSARVDVLGQPVAICIPGGVRLGHRLMGNEKTVRAFARYNRTVSI